MDFKMIPEIDRKYIPALGRLFTPIVMDSLLLNQYSPYLSEVCNSSGLLKKIEPSTTFKQFLEWIYNVLFKSYRNEYIYKNVLTNKILLGKHSLTTSNILTEFRVGQNKADVVLINGTSTVYEIKSEYDSFDRLENQIKTYTNTFDHINVITSHSQVEKLFSLLPEKVGILVLTDRNTISTKRKSKSNKDNINPDLLFDSIRKDEYTRIIKEYYGSIPEVPNTRIYRECKQLFRFIPPDISHDLTMTVLKKRNNSKSIKRFIDCVPPSISAYAMSIRGHKKKMQKLVDLFDRKVTTLLIPSAI